MTDSGTAQPSNARRPFALRLARALRRLATDRVFRNATWLQWVRPTGLFQPFNDTVEDRYPKLFEFVQAQLGGDSAVHILSFGCSTGEEVFTLRRYFPRAAIKGIDINPVNVAAAGKRLAAAPDAGLSFVRAGSTAGEQDASYDAIFCLAVLRHGSLKRPGITRCDHLIRFEDFAAAVADFHRCLKPGGLLAIRFSNFRLRDAPVSTQFETLLRLDYKAHLPLFGPDNRLLKDAKYPDVVFRKVAR